MKSLITTITLLTASLALSSCENTNKKADAMCECWRDVRIANEDEYDMVYDSCITLYKDIMKSYEGDEEGFKEFVEVYDNCR